MWSARWRWIVFPLWFVATIGIFVFSLSVGGIKTLDVNSRSDGPTLEASEAYDVFGAGEPVAPEERIVIVLDGGEAAERNAGFQSGLHEFLSEFIAQNNRLGREISSTYHFTNKVVPC